MNFSKMRNLSKEEYEFDTKQRQKAAALRTVNIRDTEVNIIPYLSKDGGGKIQRGTWHEVEIVPNRLTRINASIFIQLFTQSRGGGDF